MYNNGKYGISIFGEFQDRSMESEFLDVNLAGNARVTGHIVLLFGVIYLLFLGSDYYALKNTNSFLIAAFGRVLFFLSSAAFFLFAGKIKKHRKLICLTTSYTSVAVIIFLAVLNSYQSLRYLSVFSLLAISLVIYLIPNRVIHAQILSIALNTAFFLFFTKKIEEVQNYDLYKLLVYDLIFLIYCNLSAYLANFYKRKQFADSRELQSLSAADPLTGIYNRAKFDEELNRWVSFCQRYNQPLSLVFFDIDDFKKVNDSYGHLAGDNVIKNIVELISRSIRSTDVFARWGGEEFIILLPDTDILQAAEMAERMRVRIQENQYGIAEGVTCSFGIAALKNDETARSFLRRADELLLHAKASGKNIVAAMHA